MNNDLIAYYAKRAQEYEKVYEKPERQADLATFKQLLITEFASEKVLEIACGTGYWTPYIAEKADMVLATDINQEVIDIAQSKLYRRANAAFAKADLYSLPQRSAEFTALFGGFIWSHIPLEKLSAFLKTVSAPLRGKSKMVFIDNQYVESSSTPISKTDSWGNTYQVRKLENGTSHLVLKNFPTEAEIRQKLPKEATQVDYKPLRYFWYLKFVI